MKTNKIIWYEWRAEKYIYIYTYMYIYVCVCVWVGGCVYLTCFLEEKLVYLAYGKFP